MGASEQVVALSDGATVKDAIKSLADEHAEHFSKFVFSGDQLLPSILLSLNDQQVDEQAELSDGDVLTLISAISGG